MVFRGNGGLYDPEDLKPNYLIQTWPLINPHFGWNENGLVVDMYPSAKNHATILPPLNQIIFCHILWLPSMPNKTGSTIAW